MEKVTKVEVVINNINEALKDNDEKVLIVEVNIGNTPSDEVDEYIGNVALAVEDIEKLNGYEKLYIPFRTYKERTRITKIKKSALNKAGRFNGKK